MSKKIQLSLLSVALVSSLHAQEVKLDAITITSATKNSQALKDVTSNVSVITSAEIEEKRYTSVAQALSNVAGINYTSNGGLGSTGSIHIRGAGNNRTLVLIDGVRYQNPSSTSGASMQNLMVNDIEQIEIIKGAQSGIWGADASAGVINIITKSAQKGTHFGANIEAGSFNTQKIGANVSHKTSKYDVKLSASHVKSDGFSVQSPWGDDVERYEDDAYKNTNLKLQANYYVSDNAKITADITSIQALKDYDSYANPNDTTLQSDVSDLLYSLSYSQEYKNHSLTAKIQKSDFSRDEIGTVAQFGTEYVKEFEGEYINFELSDTISYNDQDFITLGLGTSSDEVTYIKTDTSSTNKKNKNNYIYATNSNTIEKFIFTQSIRYDDYNNFDSKATGKLGLKYSFTTELFVTANAGLAYNVPNIVQELNPWGAVNPELNPEDTTSYDVTLGYKGLQATYFHNKVTDLIDWYDPDGFGENPAIYKNLDGENTFKGYEFQYSQNITEEFSTSLNYTLLSAKDKDGKELARRPKETLKANIDYYPTDALHLGVWGEYIGERYDRADKQGRQTGKYTLVNLVANYDINENFATYVKLDNLFDKDYQVVDGYATASRSFYLGMNAKF